jgi:hypothetical protein
VNLGAMGKDYLGAEIGTRVKLKEHSLMHLGKHGRGRVEPGGSSRRTLLLLSSPLKPE